MHHPHDLGLSVRVRPAREQPVRGNRWASGKGGSVSQPDKQSHSRVAADWHLHTCSEGDIISSSVRCAAASRRCCVEWKY